MGSSLVIVTQEQVDGIVTLELVGEELARYFERVPFGFLDPGLGGGDDIDRDGQDVVAEVERASGWDRDLADGADQR